MPTDPALIARAKKAFTRCESWEATARTHFRDDMKFGNGDAYNGWQWPDDLRTYRSEQRKPTLTINKTRIHCLQIINDQRQNKTSISIKPVGDEGSAEAASILEGIIRSIEYRSNAQAAYDAASWNQVFGGWGYIRVHVDYADENSFDQDIFIQRVANPLNVYLDPDIKEYDGSDARFAFIFEDLARDEAKAKYPKYEEEFDDSALDNNDAWNTRDNVRVCEWFEKTHKRDVLVALSDGSTGLKSKIGAGEYRQAKDTGAIVRERVVLSPEITWRLMIGSEIVDEKPWPGKYIPLSRVIGQELIVDGQLDRFGHVRCLIDAQRMYNYQTSGAVEVVATQTKTPWLAADAAIVDYKNVWSRANIDNQPFLPWKHVDEAGNPIPPPQRINPPAASAAFAEGLQIAQSEMMMASGQYQAVMGAPSNETSGKAINARQRQGENATYHFIDHMASAIRHVGRLVLDLIPIVYDVPRVMTVLGRDDKQRKVQMDPNAQQGVQQVQDPDSDEFDPARIAAVLNPNVGRYEVQSDVGPSYGTQRQETFNALTQILTSHKDLFPVIGDLWAKSADFDGAEEIARRLDKGRDKSSPEMQKMQQMAQQGQQEIEQLHAALQSAKKQLDDQARDLDRKDYEAETDRMKAVGSVDPDAFKPVIRELVSQALGTHIGPLMDNHAMADQARMAPPSPPSPMPGMTGAVTNG